MSVTLEFAYQIEPNTFVDFGITFPGITCKLVTHLWTQCTDTRVRSIFMYRETQDLITLAKLIRTFSQQNNLLKRFA